MTYEQYRQEVDALLAILEYDLKEPIEDCGIENMDTLSKVSYRLGTYENCVSQAKRHIGIFLKKTKEQT